MDEMVGKIFNDWLILKARPDNRKGFVLAQCFCGKVKQVRGRSIKDNTSKHCGCKKGEKLRDRQRIPGTNSALRAIFSLYRGKSKRQNKLWELDIHTFKNITSLNCFYCDLPPSNKSIKHKYTYYYNGIDRLDNDKGYILTNIVPCCYHCNTLKGGITKNMIYKLYKKLYDNT